LNARARYLEALGIPRYVLRRSKSPPAGADAAPTWQELERAVAACTRCGLCRGRTRTVFGIGARDASLMVVGEAPGAEEDRQGEPFVGPAGQLLNAMLAAVDLAREATFIANIVKCRPPQNRDPSPEEIAACMPHLARQIALVNPRALLTVGRIAAQTLLRTDLPVGRLRGQVFHYGELRIPLVVTYHPAYLLRTPLAKAKAWEDLCVMRELLARV
jgi:uracil-DNA glycosylase family 4